MSFLQGVLVAQWIDYTINNKKNVHASIGVKHQLVRCEVG